jgi:hypothetical protein
MSQRLPVNTIKDLVITEKLSYNTLYYDYHLSNVIRDCKSYRDIGALKDPIDIDACEVYYCKQVIRSFDESAIAACGGIHVLRGYTNYKDLVDHVKRKFKEDLTIPISIFELILDMTLGEHENPSEIYISSLLKGIEELGNMGEHCSFNLIRGIISKRLPVALRELITARTIVSIENGKDQSNPKTYTDILVLAYNDLRSYSQSEKKPQSKEKVVSVASPSTKKRPANPSNEVNFVLTDDQKKARAALPKEEQAKTPCAFKTCSWKHCPFKHEEGKTTYGTAQPKPDKKKSNTPSSSSSSGTNK